MASTASLEGVKKAVFFPFQGKDWAMKMVIGGALNFVNFIIPLIPMIAVLGYSGQIMKGVLTRDEDPQLPEWKDWGAFFLDGLKMFAVLMIYNLPAIIVIAFGYILMLFVPFGMGLFNALTINPNSPSVAPFFSSFLASMGGTFIGIGLVWLGILLFIICSFFFPPAMAHMFARGNFGAAFRIKEWWPILKGNITGYLLVLAFALGMSFILVFAIQILYVTVIFCILLPFLISFLGFFIAVASYSLFAIAYRDGARKLAGTSA